MFDIVFDRSNETATPLGTFVVTKGNVTKGSAPLVTWFNDKSVIIAMNARSSFTLPSEHSMFDQLLLTFMSKNIGVMYVESLTKFMDPKARFAEFLDGTIDPASFGMTLNVDQLQLPAIYAQTKSMFDAMFTPPTPSFSAGINLTEFFSDSNITNIEAWRKGQLNNLSTDVRAKINSNRQDKAGLLRIVKSGNSQFVENDMGHRVTKTRFVEAYNRIVKPLWDRYQPDARPDESLNNNGSYGTSIQVKESGDSYNSNKNISVFADHIRLGCQRIPRAEVEAVVAQLTA